MSRHSSHMMRRDGVYWLRVRAPTHLRTRLGKGELRRSLGTTRSDIASLRVSVALAWFRELCFLLPSMPTLSAADINALVVQFFRRLTEEVGIPTVPPGEDISLWADEQHASLEDFGNQIEEDLQLGKVPGMVHTQLAAFLGKQGVALNELPAQQRADLEQGATRAALEQVKYIRFRLNKPVGTYLADDQLFKHALDAKLDASSEGGLAAISIGNAIKEYLAQRKPQWVASTYRDNQKVLTWAEELFGTAKPIGAVTKAHVAELKQKFVRLRKHATGGSFETRLTEDAEKRISARTASKYFDFVSSFFAWAEREQAYIEKSPAHGLVVSFNKTKSQAAKSATPDAVKAFVQSPLFQGHLHNKLHKSGPVVFRSGEYWLFIIQLLTGMRVGEVAQLLCADVVLDEGVVPHLHVRTTDEFGGTEGIKKTAKTMSSVRRVPVPDLLISLGFAEFHKERSKKGKQLFPEFPASNDGSTSDAATKFASRYLQRIKQKLPGKATHWLRHAWTDAMRAGGAPQYVIYLIDGHKLDGMAEVYGTGDSLTACKEWIDKANFQFDLGEALAASSSRWV